MPANNRQQFPLVISCLFVAAVLIFTGVRASGWLDPDGSRSATTPVEQESACPPSSHLGLQHVSLSNDGARLLIGYGRALAPLEHRLYDSETLALVRTIAATRPCDGAICVSQAVMNAAGDDVVQAVGHLDGTVALSTAGRLLIRKLHANAVQAIACAPHGRFGASADELLHVWEIPSGRIIKTLELPPRVHHLVFSPDSDHLAATTADGTLLVWEWAGRGLILTGHAPGASSVAFSNDSHHLLTGHAYGEIRLWSLEAARQLRQSTQRPDTVSALAFLPDNRSFVCATTSRELEVWRGGEIVDSTTLPSSPRNLAVSRDGRRLFVGCLDGSVHVCETNPLRCVVDQSTKALAQPFGRDESTMSGDVASLVESYLPHWFTFLRMPVWMQPTGAPSR